MLANALPFSSSISIGIPIGGGGGGIEGPNCKDKNHVKYYELRIYRPNHISC